jgi:hypothetical protein
LNSLVQEWGGMLGQAIFAQSRNRSEERGPIGVRPQLHSKKWRKELIFGISLDQVST